MRSHRCRDRLLPLLPGILLASVALAQITLFVRSDISPWKGGGFGMFSSNEGGWARHSHVFLSSADGEIEIDVPEDLEEPEERLRTLPSDSRIERFARGVSGALASQHPWHTGVRVELWRTGYDPTDLTPTSELMREHHQARSIDARD